MIRFGEVCDRKSKLLLSLNSYFLINGHWKDFFVLSAPLDHKRCSPILTIVTKTIATGQTIDRKYFLSLADQQSVDQQAFKVVSSFIKLPRGNLMSDSCEEHIKTVTVHTSNIVSHNQILLKPGLINDSQSSCPWFFWNVKIFGFFAFPASGEKSDSNGQFVIVASLQTDCCTAVPLCVPCPSSLPDSRESGRHPRHGLGTSTVASPLWDPRN